MILILFYIIGIGSLLVNIFEPRTLTYLNNPDLYSQTFILGNNSAVIMGRITTALFLLACMIGIIYGVFYWKDRYSLFASQGSLLTSAGLFLNLPVILSALVSGNGGFRYQLFFLPLFMIAAYLSPRFNPIQQITKILPVLLVFIYTSLIAMFLKPSWAFSSFSGSWIGIPTRLLGTTTQPNGLGYIALSYLILARLNNRKSVWSYVHIIAVIIVLILSQSKTAWSALIIWLIAERMIKVFSTRRQTASRILTTMLMLVLLTATYIILFRQDYLKSVVGYYINLSGRTDVWKITWKMWLNNPIFGYGPNLWDATFRYSLGYSWAGQAHNQFLQTLGESGLIGFGGLLFYLFVVIKLGSRYATATNYASIGIIITILIRSFTEVPLRNYVLDQSFLIHAIFLVILVNSESLLIDPNKLNE